MRCQLVEVLGYSDRPGRTIPYDLRGIALSLSCILVFSESERGHTCSSAFACRWLNLARLGLSLSLAFAHFAPNFGDEKLERKVRPLVGLGDTPIGDGTRMKLCVNMTMGTMLAAYGEALAGYAAGSPEGVAAWLVHCCRATEHGALEGLAICESLLRG